MIRFRLPSKGAAIVRKHRIQFPYHPPKDLHGQIQRSCQTGRDIVRGELIEESIHRLQIESELLILNRSAEISHQVGIPLPNVSPEKHWVFPVHRENITCTVARSGMPSLPYEANASKMEAAVASKKGALGPK